MNKSRQVSTTVDTKAICHYKARPDLRPDCQHRAVVVYGTAALCRSCDIQRSTMGKGMVGRNLVHGRDWSALETVEVAAKELREAEHNLVGAVVAARRFGHSWAELGVALGTTRQAAHQRFAGTMID